MTDNAFRQVPLPQDLQVLCKQAGKFHTGDSSSTTEIQPPLRGTKTEVTWLVSK